LLPLLLLVALERGGFDDIWCGRDALALLRAMDRLMEDRLSGAHGARS
jgi:hypothetical protein